MDLVDHTLAERYRVEARLGDGAAGSVWRACDLSSGRRVALKLLHGAGSEAGSGGDLRKRFAREVDALAKLSHPAVLAIHDLCPGPERSLVLVMELAEGGSLEDRLARTGPLPVEEVRRLGIALAEGLEHAHAAGVLHRDLKPSNVLLAGGGRPKLADFGLARDLTLDQTRLTKTGHFLGTPDFWPPEQARGQHEQVGPRSDVYGLCGVLYAALTGDPPRGEATSLMNALALLEQPVVGPRQRRGEVPLWLDQLICQGLQEDSSLRPDSAGELASALQEQRPSSSASGVPGAALRRRSLGLVLALLSGFCLGLAALSLTWGRAPLEVEVDAHAVSERGVAWLESRTTAPSLAALTAARDAAWGAGDEAVAHRLAWLAALAACSAEDPAALAEARQVLSRAPSGGGLEAHRWSVDAEAVVVGWVGLQGGPGDPAAWRGLSRAAERWPAWRDLAEWRLALALQLGEPAAISAAADALAQLGGPRPALELELALDQANWRRAAELAPALQAADRVAQVLYRDLVERLAADSAEALAMAEAAVALAPEAAARAETADRVAALLPSLASASARRGPATTLGDTLREIDALAVRRTLDPTFSIGAAEVTELSLELKRRGEAVAAAGFNRRDLDERLYRLAPDDPVVRLYRLDTLSARPGDQLEGDLPIFRNAWADALASGDERYQVSIAEQYAKALDKTGQVDELQLLRNQLPDGETCRWLKARVIVYRARHLITRPGGQAEAERDLGLARRLRPGDLRVLYEAFDAYRLLWNQRRAELAAPAAADPVSDPALAPIRERLLEAGGRFVAAYEPDVPAGPSSYQHLGLVACLVRLGPPGLGAQALDSLLRRIKEGLPGVAAKRLALLARLEPPAPGGTLLASLKDLERRTEERLRGTRGLNTHQDDTDDERVPDRLRGRAEELRQRVLALRRLLEQGLAGAEREAVVRHAAALADEFGYGRYCLPWDEAPR